MTYSEEKELLREQIILWHLDGFVARGFNPPIHRNRRSNGSSIEERVQRCMQHIAEAGAAGSYPGVSEASLTHRFRAQRDRALAEQASRREPELISGLAALRAKNAALIEQFYVVAERKVSLRDEYGDENWEALDREVDVLLQKIAKKHGYTGGWDEHSTESAYHRLSSFLKQSFRERRADLRARPVGQPDFSTLSGEDFEAYLMDLLSRLGYTVCGTKSTGDQGADMLATKDGRTIVIQAKNYRDPVGNAAVQEVTAAVHFYSGHEGWVITNSTFTPAARDLAQRAGVRLIDGHELARLSRPVMV